jgi:acyl-CoA synthetase (AMP-forming)/AMP-acid ligase II
MYTSGTTGPAKGVLHSHASLPYAVGTAMRRWGFAPGDLLLMPSPVTHITGYCIGLELPFSLQTTTVLMESWNAQDAVRLIEQHEVAGTVGATPFLQQLCEAAEARGGAPLPMRVFACGGAAVPGELIRRASNVLRGYACRCYGSTEAPLVTAGRAPDQPEALGADTDGCIADYDVRLVDAQERDVAPGGEGEILVRGNGLFLGYSRPENTREAFTADGYFRTGDIGVRGDDGTLTITGRKKDLIIRGGENLSAKEIEDALLRHPAVIEAAVVSAPDALMGESVCAYLRTRAGAAPGVAELAAVVRDAGLARQKAPEHVRVLEDFPRTASGKIRKDRLRALIREELSGASTQPGQA